MANAHHISLLRYRVDCPDEKQAFELRHLLSSTATDELSSRMEEVSDRYVGNEEFVRIPRLEVRLEASSLHALTGDISTKFGIALEEELRKILAQQAPGLPPDQHAGSQAEAFFYFLVNGVLPRWASALGIHFTVVAARVIHKQPKPLLKFLYQHAGQKNIWRRIAFQFPEQFKEDVIALVCELEDALEELKAAYAAYPGHDGASEAIPGKEIIARMMVEIVLLEAPGLIAGNITGKDLLPYLLYLISRWTGNPDDRPEYPPPIPAGPIPMRRLPDITVTHHGGSIAPPQPKKEAADDTGDEKIGTNTAGIVLLHPFLKPLFTQLAFLREGEWIDTIAQQRAVHLLHFLGTGNQEQPEWNLVQEKLMCGLTPDIPIDRNIILTEIEISECEQLLASVIEHWSALKNSSARGLQESFFKRKGLLQKTKERWVLQVERKTQDVLLDALPWNYSMIKLPWTKYMIEVLW